MRTCTYCLWEIADEAKKCKYCWEWVVDSKSKVKCKWKKCFKRILLVIAILAILALTFLWIKRYKQKEFNRELLNNYYEKQISATWEVAMSNAIEVMDNYIPQTSTEKKVMNELSGLIVDFSEKMNSFSEDLFFIEDESLHETYRINLAINQLENYKKALNDYVNKLKWLFNELIDEYWMPGEIWKYSIFDVLDKMEQFASQEEKFVDKSVEYYNYVLTIQDKFYYDKTKDQLYFYSNGPLNKFNTLRKEFYNVFLDTIDAEENFNNYIVEYFKYRKNILD